MTDAQIERAVQQIEPAKRVNLRRRIQDPVLFSRYFLDEDPWDLQCRIMRSVVENPWTSVKACHSSSKTRTASNLVLWWLARYGEALVLTTAPGERQVKGLLWREIHHLINRQRSKVGYPDPVGTELRIHDKSFATGFVARIDATDEGVRYQGPHSEHTLIVVDEAPGVHAKAYEAFQGIMASGHCRLLELGNPTITGGPFYESHTARRGTRACFTISAFQTPNLAPLGIDPQARTEDAVAPLLGAKESELEAMTVRPYLVSPRWVRDRWYEWGAVGSPLWDARVLGEFPKQSQDALIALAWLERSKVEENEAGVPMRCKPPVGAHFRAGVDVAGPGDAETVCTVMDDQGQIIDMQAWIHANAAPDVIAMLQPYKHRLEWVNCDSAGADDFYRRIADGGIPNVQGVNVGTAVLPIERNASEKYVNLKAQAYWGLRKLFEDSKIRGLFDEETISQLSTIRYDHDARGRIQIEKKIDARKRGCKSPDRAESLMLCCLNYRKFRARQSSIRVI